jgi:hypothetical protein
MHYIENYLKVYLHRFLPQTASPHRLQTLIISFVLSSYIQGHVGNHTLLPEFPKMLILLIPYGT